tara:strand:- start:90 stop:785 length:696 start_codon:yes stop_codon:yes gene_type:complete
MANNIQSNLSKDKNYDDEALKIGIGGKLSPETNEGLYKKRMKKRKEIQSKRLEMRKSQKGLVIVFTGNGKGKTTASLGMAVRTLGHDQKVVIIQFIKGAWETGEEKAFKKLFNNITWHSLGEGFTWETQDRIRDEECVINAWQIAKKYIEDNSYKLIILDEINIAFKLGYLEPLEVVSFLKKLHNQNNHIVLTGRGAPKAILEFADLVTEMNLIKHPFRDQGIKAQKCVEY